MIWNTIANARRMMKKDGSIKQHAKQICKIRKDRETSGQKEKVKPRTRLNQKTAETEVEKKNMEWSKTQQVIQTGSAKAEPNRNKHENQPCT